jgi:hypothetical protein
MAIQYSEISREIVRLYTALAGEMSGHNPAGDS